MEFSKTEEESTEGAIADVAEAALNEAANYAPETLKPYVKAAQRAVQPISSFIENQLPRVLAAYDALAQAWGKAQNYQQYSGIFLGLLLMLFGGAFAATIAAVEAFRQIAWEATKTNMSILYKQYQIAEDAAKKDEDEHPRDGSEDEQIALRRRALVIFKAVDPDLISNAAGAIWSGLFAVVCALRVKFAHAVSLGVAIGDMTTAVVHRHGEPILKELVGPSLHKWVPVVCRWMCRGLSITIAWTLQRIIVAFHSSLRGANMFVDGCVQAAIDRKMIKKGQLPPRSSARYNGVVQVFAVLGFLWQVRSGFGLIFPLNLLLLPLTMFESFLTLLVGTWTTE